MYIFNFFKFIALYWENLLMSCQFLSTKGWVCKTVEYFDTGIYFYIKRFEYNLKGLVGR